MRARMPVSTSARGLVSTFDHTSAFVARQTPTDAHGPRSERVARSGSCALVDDAAQQRSGSHRWQVARDYFVCPAAWRRRAMRFLYPTPISAARPPAEALVGSIRAATQHPLTPATDCGNLPTPGAHVRGASCPRRRTSPASPRTRSSTEPQTCAKPPRGSGRRRGGDPATRHAPTGDPRNRLRERRPRTSSLGGCCRYVGTPGTHRRVSPRSQPRPGCRRGDDHREVPGAGRPPEGR